MSHPTSLRQYYPAPMIDAAWEIGPDLEFRTDGRGGVEVGTRYGTTAFHTARRMVDQYGTNEVISVFYCYKTLYESMKSGPIIVRPKLDLCLAMQDTEIRVPIVDFRMPFPIMAFELPRSFTGTDRPQLVWLCRPTDEVNTMFSWNYLIDSRITYHLVYDPRTCPTIEDRLENWSRFDNGTMRVDGSEQDKLYLFRAQRVITNLAFLATQRRLEPVPLPPNVERRRRRGVADRVGRLNLEVPQEYVFRDLFIRKAGVGDREIIPTGHRQEAQHRRGYWRQTAHGPQHSLRKYQWISDYWTHKADAESDPKTIVMR